MGSCLLLTNFCLFSFVGGKLLDPPSGSFVGLFKRSVPFRDGLSIPTLSLPSISDALPVFTFPTYLSLPRLNNLLKSAYPISILPCARNLVYAFSGSFW